jgi:deoxyribodipyrimidine photo-lyase
LSYLSHTITAQFATISVNHTRFYYAYTSHAARDNWALLHAQQRATAIGVPLVVVFNLVSKLYLGAARRHYGFMLRGLEGVRAALAKKKIPFVLLRGEAGAAAVPRFAQLHNSSVGLLQTCVNHR